MKAMNTFLLAGALALGFTVVNVARADEPFLSPRAKANQIKVAPSTGTSPKLVSGDYPGAAVKLEARGTVGSSGDSSPNLVSGNYAGAAAKNPARGSQFEIAPLVGKGKTCEPGCTKACCAKR